MALTNSRPLQIPTMENEMLHNSTSPIFQLSAINLNANARSLASNTNIITSFPGSETVDLLDVNPAMNPNANGHQGSPSKKRNNSNGDDSSSHNGKSSGNNKTKKDSVSSKKENPLLEVSKLIPVTGERPAPEDRAPPLNDDVLFAVFVILWESDVEQNGLTVKQLCDILLAKHPEMSDLSTKLSNLISAKLNAYVKKIEKGEKTMKYAISREWSNSSPRRMLYIYRGILAPDYKEHAKKVTNQLKQQMAQDNEAKQESQNTDPSSFFDGNATNSSPNGLTMDNVMNKGNISMSTNTGFSLSPGFNIPYSSSPVSVTLNQNTPNKSTMTSGDNSKKKQTKQKSNDLMNKQTESNDTKKRSNENMKNESSSDSNNGVVNNKNLTTPQNKKQKMNNNQNSNDPSGNPSRSTTMTPTLLDGANNNNSNNTTITTGNTTGVSASSNKQSTYITAVAAAPRISKLLPKSGIRSTISNHIPHNGNNSLIAMFHQTPCTPKLDSESIPEDGTTEDNAWLKIVREGFLTKDIQSPESISLEELDSII
ncbi:similar to Saccharomyces cerevisiae YOR355W GDS1 Protein of unknown function, required for growth on glycerol as a carbon source [Maudiozyma saulgeensis]|uniref:GDS1 winged helix domain-containing protein n=1 Tax=Maudiozyma saulgeensis TaxID=1789683 RepID=A0A1X7R4W8_9SACH|nr:similar to Saccharomyces cerevisiae YOR355W GDS1 Protein of unknown function, required for growth on glycerol as a carbon source [Kazachstania saulgeensis]